MDLTIVIINWNLDEQLRKCIDSILEATKDINCKVFIFDNNSTEVNFDEIINNYSKYRMFEFIKNKENIGALTINAIKDRLEGRYLLIVGPDAILKKESIRNLVEFMDSKKDAGAASAKLLNPDGSPQFYYYKFWNIPMVFYCSTILGGLIDRLLLSNRNCNYYTGRNLDVSSLIEIDQPPGSCFIMRTELLKKDDFIIDPEFPFYYNDVDLCRRIWNKGYKIYLVPNAEVIHDHHSSFRKAKYVWKRVEFVKSQVKYFRKHHPSKVWILKMIHIVDAISRIPYYLLVKILRRKKKSTDLNKIPLSMAIMSELEILRNLAKW